MAAGTIFAEEGSCWFLGRYVSHCWKMYDSIYHMVACGFMAYVLPDPNFNKIHIIPVHINTFKSNSKHITVLFTT